MKLSHFVKLMIFITLVSLVYINMQSRIVEMAYQGKKKEHQMRKFMEENGHLDYAISKLKSSPHIGSKMLAKKDSMRFADAKQIVLVLTDPKNLPEKQEVDSKPTLANLFSIGAQAEAKASE